MNNLRTSLIKNNKYFKFVLFLLLLGLLIGFLLYKRLDNTHVLEEIKIIATYLSENRINFLFLHFIIISLLIISTFLFVGIIIFPIYIVFESICITYNILSFISVFKFNGFIFSFIYNILSKGLFLILLIIILKKVLNIFKLLIINFNRKDLNVKSDIIKNIKHAIICLFLIIINDIFIYLFLNKILLKFLFIIN